MADLPPPTWAPKALDVEAQQADRPRLALLHDATARAAVPVFSARFHSLAAGAIEGDLLHQVTALQNFLMSGEPTASPDAGGDSATHAELRDQLREFLGARLPEPEAAAGDAALARQMAAEFAVACWATLLSRLNRQRGADDLVDPRALLPDDLLAGRTPLLEQVRADALHFGLSSEELNEVMAATLETLARTDVAEPGVLCWPLGLRVDRPALRAHVQQAQIRRWRAVQALQGRQAAAAVVQRTAAD
jgi:hypothetical protein